jgi:hypothetical protein
VQLHVEPGTEKWLHPWWTLNLTWTISRHNTSSGGIVKHSERNALLPREHFTADLQHSTCSRHICQLSGRDSPRSRLVYLSRRTKYRIQSSSCPSRLPFSSKLASCPHRRLNWNQHSTRVLQRARQVAHT